MNRIHCDRCDKVVEGYPTWVEVKKDETAGTWHLDIKGTDLCIDCKMNILSEYLQHLAVVKKEKSDETDDGNPAGLAKDTLPFV